MEVCGWGGYRGWTGQPDRVYHLFNPLLSSFYYAGCLQTVATICCRRNYWFYRLLVFPALFSCSFSTPLHPPQRGTVVSHVSSGFCRCVSQERHGQTIPVQDIQGHGLSMPPNPIA